MSNLSPLMRDNCDIASFYSTKLSWKGKYRRVFSIGTDGITTSNPQTFQCTNQWAYKEIAGVLAKRDTGVANEFHLVVQKPGKKLDTLKFSCEHRAELLTAVLKFRSKFADQTAFTVKQFKAHKHHWSDNRIPVTLQVTPSTIDQLEVSTGRVLCSYDYQEIEGFAVVSDDNEAFVIYYGGFQRMHMFSCLARSELIESARKNAEQHIGVSLKCKEGVPYENFDTFRLGKFSDDDSLTSLVEFKVSKVSVRTMEPTRRLLCVSECAIIERDVPTYTVINLKPLSDVFAIVRDGNNPQLFTIEYVKCGMRQYLSTERDSLLATLLDSVRSSGNHFVSIEMSALDRGKRVTPLFSHAEDEVELALLKLLTSSTGKPFKVAVQRFNANVSYNGLSMSNPSDARDKLVQSALISLLEKDGDSSASSAAASDSSSSVSSVELHAQFGAIRRLVASKPGFNAFGLMTGVREKLGKKVVKALRRADSGVTHAAIEMLCALMQPMHDNYDLKQEQNNKSALMASDKFVDALLDLLAINLSRGSGALIISALLDFITYALCAPYSETTDGATFDKLLDKVSKLGRIIFKLFQHPSMSITKSAGMIMRALIEEGSEANAKHMQDLALAEGAFPKHLLTALFTDVNPGARGVDRKTLASRQLSRYLIGLWHCGNEEAHDLLKRMFPAGLLSFLSSDETPPSNEFELLLVRPDNLKLAQEQSSKPRRLLPGTVAGQEVERYFHHWKGKLEQGMHAVGVSGGGGAAGQKEENRPIVLRRRRQRVKASENWALFYYNFNQDHQMSNLIWNHKTREEVRETLENELRAFSTDIELSANENIAWNHREFQVRYLCLSEEIKIGDYFLRVLLDESEDKLFFQKPYDFFNDLYHRFLTSQRSDMRCICLQAMTIVYRKCHPAIGAFNDTQFIFQNLEKTNERAERDRLVQFVEALMHCEKNAKHLLDCNGVKVLVELLTLAHLHTSRATVPLQSNLIEASPEMGTGASSEKEWYYTVGGPDNKKQGPVSFEELKQLHAKGAFDSKTRFWAQGMEGWKSMRNISQLKWTLLATDQPVLNESELCVRVLNILNRICSLYSSRDASGAVIRPLPRIRRMLSEPSNLPHLVQLLLTFDPMIVEKTVLLVHNIMLDNPLVSRLFSTGLFFFILMYTGSNVLPVAELLYYSHLKQAFRSVDDSTSDIMRNSVLGSLLPHAMVYFLENHGPSQFATVFLGEYDTPEAIWSNVMRQHLILKIAQHIADFSPRLRSNNRAVYQYCALPAVHYPQLDGELFVNIFYLRNFCNTAKFPNWQVSDPVGLLRECLDNWKKEVAKKPSSFNEKEALEKLGLKPGVEYSESEIRRAYFKLAQKYHPDKNPDGREMFEEINTAYEFLYNRRANKHSDGPNPQHIDLLLKTQSILFNNYSHELQPYKYAGYPNLLATIQMEIEDNTLFGKALPLLPSATELCFHTVHCSALNAEELRRERGLVMLQSAMDKCISGITKQSSQEEMRVQVCRNVIMCFSVAAQFEQSRKELLEMPSVVKNLCRIMSFKHLPGVCVECCRCVGVFGRDSLLQSSLLESGVLWHLILFLFNYDYTLDEAHGINADTSTHETEVLNRVAKKSVSALRKLAGFGGRVKLPASHLRKKSSRALALSLSQTGSLINNNNISPSEDTNNNNTNGAGSLTNGVSSSEKEEEVMSGGTGGGEEGSGEDDLANGTNDNDAQEDDDLLESDKGVVYPENGTIRACLSALLTPYLYRCMLNKSDYEFLKLLNSNSENPYLIWDNGTRTELMEYVKRNQADILRTGECEASFGSDFVFSSHSEELVVGDIYVRVYNEQPQFPLEQPTLFARNLIAFLGSEAEYLQSLLSLENDSSSGDSKKEAQLSLTEERTKRVKNVSQALIALKNCIRNNQGVEKECMGHFKLLFSLLASFRSPKLQLEAKALQVISCVVCNKECVASIADAQVLGFLLVCFEQLSQQVDLVLDCVHQLASNRDIVKECKRRGAFIYILHEFCSSRDPSVRTKSAELFAKLMATNLHGAEVRIFLSQFLPPLFMDAMRDNAENSVHMFESVQENPELVWRDETRERVKKTVKKLRQQLLTEQMRDPNFVFQLPKDFAVEGIKAEGVVIEGVILSIYVSQPGWVVRRPVEFMTGLLVHFKQMCTAREPPSEAEVDLVVSATGVFFLGQKSLLPRVCETGCIPSIVQALVSPTIYISVAAVKLIHILSVDPLCVRDLSKAKCIEPLMVAMRKSSQCLVFACEALNKLFSNGDTYLVRQALDGELIEYLLSLLSKPLEAADNQKSVKAHIADALKAMAKDPHLGEEVSKLLDESSVWKEFKSQKHDLFLENSPPAGFLTGGAQVAGYLTQTASTNGVNMPPPIEPHHHPQD